MFYKFCLLSSPLFLVTALILYYLKANYILIATLVCVGILSCIHHSRTKVHNLDIIRCVDIFFAISLGIIVFFMLGPWSLAYLIPVILIYLFISKNKYFNTLVRCCWHMILHLIVCSGIIIQSYIKYKK